MKDSTLEHGPLYRFDIMADVNRFLNELNMILTDHSQPEVTVSSETLLIMSHIAAGESAYECANRIVFMRDKASAA